MPGKLAAKTIASASDDFRDREPALRRRVYATMTPWLNQPSANTPAQKPACAPAAQRRHRQRRRRQREHRQRDQG